jgi:predicted DsbA family dithiol-disulfide isomerase
MTLTSVHFFADPCCPWTWNTSRWLVEASQLAGFTITWRTLSLAELNKDREVSEHLRPRLTCSRRMARVLEALRADGRNDEMARASILISTIQVTTSSTLAPASVGSTSRLLTMQSVTKLGTAR